VDIININNGAGFAKFGGGGGGELVVESGADEEGGGDGVDVESLEEGVILGGEVEGVEPGIAYSVVEERLVGFVAHARWLLDFYAMLGGVV